MPKAHLVFAELARAGRPANRPLPRPAGMGPADGPPSQPRPLARAHERPREPQGHDLGARARPGARGISRHGLGILPARYRPPTRWRGAGQAARLRNAGGGERVAAGRRFQAGRESHFPRAEIPDKLPPSGAARAVSARARRPHHRCQGTGPRGSTAHMRSLFRHWLSLASCPRTGGAGREKSVARRPASDWWPGTRDSGNWIFGAEFDMLAPGIDGLQGNS